MVNRSLTPMSPFKRYPLESWQLSKKPLATQIIRRVENHITQRNFVVALNQPWISIPTQVLPLAHWPRQTCHNQVHVQERNEVEDASVWHQPALGRRNKGFRLRGPDHHISTTKGTKSTFLVWSDGNQGPVCHLAQFHYVRLPEYQEFMRDSVPTWRIMSKTLKELWSNWDEQFKPESMKNLIM